MTRRQRLFVLGSIAGLFAWLFADALFGSGVFVFRDAGHYYYPLLKFVAGEWGQGRLPLWNPYENLGVPLAADPTAAVFYPGKLVFALPIGFAWAYKLYIMGHVLLAAGTAYRLARRFGASAAAGGVCAVSYAFSGNVLFQHCNVVFLVGAAWLPAALLAADRMLLGRSRKWAVLFGLVLALMVLGGDPQMAYNAGVLAALYAVWLWFNSSPLSLWERVRVRARQLRSSQSSPTSPRNDDAPDEKDKDQGPNGHSGANDVSMAASTTTPSHPSPLPAGEGARRSRFRLLALAAATGLVLSAIQVLPSMEFAKQSGRRSSQSFADLLCAKSHADTHQEHTYHFSVGPWRVAEYLWPNVAGRQFPTHRRWLSAIPAEGRTWVPSLYMGVLPLLLALSTMRLWGKKGTGTFCQNGPKGASHKMYLSPFSGRHTAARVRWLSWTVILTVLASFGWYGPGLLIHEIEIAAGRDPAHWGPVGGPFGGVYWLMTVVLPGYAYFRYPAKLLVVAALGLSLLAARGFDGLLDGRAVRLRRVLLCVAVLSLGGAIAIAAIATGPYWHSWLGGTRPDALFGPLDTAGAANDVLWAFVQTALLCGLFWWLTRTPSEKKNGRLAPTKQTLAVVLLVLTAVDLGLANRWMVPCAPQSQWEERSKLAVAMEADDAAATGPRAANAPPLRAYRHEIWMPPAFSQSDSPGRTSEAMRWDVDSLWPKYNLTEQIGLTEVIGAMTPDDYAALWPEERAAFADYVIWPGGYPLTGLRQVPLDVEDVTLWRNPQPPPRGWIDGPKTLGGSCRVMHYDPLRVDVEVELSQPGVLILADQIYPGWKLEAATDGQAAKSLPILRTYGVLRGTPLPAGNHHLVYRFRPTSLILGAAVSLPAWLAAVVWGVRRVVRSRRSRSPLPKDALLPV